MNRGDAAAATRTFRGDESHAPGLEPVAVLIFAVLMASLSLQILVESTTALVEGLTKTPKRPNATPLVIAIMIVVIVVKFFLCIWCRRIADRGGPGAGVVEALADDHRAWAARDSTCASIAASPPRRRRDWWSSLRSGIYKSRRRDARSPLRQRRRQQHLGTRGHDGRRARSRRLLDR